MYYIFCNKDFQKAVNEIPLSSAKRKYVCNNLSCDVKYEVWELSDSDFATINENYIDSYMLDENNKDCLIWDDSWGWWRWCDGSNIEFSPTHTFKINGNDIELYYDECEVKTYASYILNEENDDYWPEEDLNKIRKVE